MIIVHHQEDGSMMLSERIQQYVQKLPASRQAEVLDFVEYLVAKSEREIVLRERENWSSLSLSTAMRGMEDENSTPNGAC
jgi:hypothetical protein